ncbi:MAG TPA: hypothetical protein VGU64_22795 [Terriglobales bacterium]|nr:hypothetical protein [Terriglobales bacterium]
MCVSPVCKFIAHRSVRNSFHRLARVAASIILAAPILAGSADAQVNVVTYHNDNARTGVNANETLLTASNVNKNNFGKLFTQNVDGIVVGQPLYLSNVSIPGSGLHNVVYVATQHDSVYAFDADNSAGINAQPLWQVSFINPAAGITTVPGPLQGCTGVTAFTELGIVSTPVIDPNTGTLYVIAKTEENGTFVHRLHAGYRAREIQWPDGVESPVQNEQRLGGNIQGFVPDEPPRSAAREWGHLRRIWIEWMQLW